ncbi:MAG: hypothetical protein [Circular genetic element sp.]|nr:MAG: hypothetical protein [Circular genetic element sp.]
MSFRNEMRRINNSAYRQKSYGKPSLQVQVDKLKRKVAANKAETFTFKQGGTITPPSTAVAQTNINLTDLIYTDSDFRDDITGSIWKNHWMDIRFLTPNDSSQFRVIVYVPKRPGLNFVPAVRNIINQPDHNTFWVLYDKALTPDVNTNHCHKARFSLKGLKSEYSSDGSTLDAGEIKVAFIYAGSTVAYTYQIQMGLSNV